MPIKLPRRRLDHLDRAPLKLAILQVRYRPLLAAEQTDNVAAFGQALGEEYEFTNRQVAQTLRVYVGDTGMEPPPPLPSDTIWRFTHKEHEWVVALSATSLALEASSYWDFDHFSQVYQAVLDAFSTVFTPTAQTRLGMRYINEIEDSRLSDLSSLEHFVNRDLLRPVGSVLGYDLISSLADLRFRESDGTLAIRHGLVRPETYLLDFDFYREDERPFSTQDVIDTTRGYHSVIESLFVWCLKKDYLDELRSQGEK
jgi:uncharacterized protein (TIGR04255 family)